jgi:PTH2 family peptidyl-tRNA hydrolase
MYKAKQMIVVRRDLKMRKGKIAAQAGHACVEAVLMALCKEGRLNDVSMVEDNWVTVNPGEKGDSPLTDWFQYGVAKICVYVDGEEALLDIAKKAKEAGVVCALIQDAGMTEFHGEPTYTCLALEPLEAEIADQFTGGLPLY